MNNRSGPETAGNSRSADFVAHWHTLPRSGQIPTLSGFLDHSQPRFAPWTIIVDIGDGTTLPIRLVGTGLADMFGEHTGVSFLSIMPPDVVAILRHAHEVMRAIPCGWLTESKVVTSNGREVIVELVSLPLMNKSAISCVAKLASVIEQLDYREAFVKVLDLRTSRWIDLGAGIP